MWLYRGAQSAVFYYATCTPCAMSIDRRKRKKDAVRTQRLNAKADPDLVTDQPRPFPQPTPFSTNEGWQEEIVLGPGPPARRHRNHPRTNSWNTDQSSLVKKDKSGGLMQPLNDKWKSMRYQREDEPLWGQEVLGSSIGFSGRGRADPDEPSKYYAAYVPPSMIFIRPFAKVMAGKERFDDMSPRDSVGGFAADWPSRTYRSVAYHNEINTESPSHEIGDGVSDVREVQQQLPRQSSVSRVRRSTESTPHDDFDIPRNSRSDSMFSIADSDQSFSASWRYPDTPATRPASKSTDESEKVYARPQISKTLSTLGRGDKHKVHLLQLEINDDPHDEVALGQLERIRPWRWSMDI
ncbi:hypothetical protein N7462_005567 [Penicillium macrosclerotiorum]|uniref:uncharacterized protein n=1 Tax=Penicillium macrosclerotiorum TaxID=303699 RepID=UPI0025499D61|nr:uncharacterized protein N7462_005567 [Penicillium macrosclerotiorum]KAJ5682402.1 hypothetical protein N7462_005567 [Penicillium macrosclerotiorum]